MIIDHGNALDHRYRAEGTCRGTGAKTDATVGADLVATAESLGGNAVVGTGIVVLAVGIFKAAGTHYLRPHSYGSGDLHAHDGAYLARHLRAADGAGVCREPHPPQ